MKLVGKSKTYSNQTEIQGLLVQIPDIKFVYLSVYHTHTHKLITSTFPIQTFTDIFEEGGN